MQFLKIVLFLTFTLSLSYKAVPDDKFGQRQINDGTYRIERTASPEDCAALCQADTDHICRGHVFYQPDVSLPDGECRLNSGIGEHSLFKIDAPDAINIKQVLMDVNEYRAEYNLLPLKWNPLLENAAAIHVKDLAFHGLVQHEGTDGSHHGERVKAQGYIYSTALENVAGGQRNWPDALQGWKDSKGHNEALLSPEVSEFGVALDFNPTTRFANYWAMVLAAPLYPSN